MPCFYSEFKLTRMDSKDQKKSVFPKRAKRALVFDEISDYKRRRMEREDGKQEKEDSEGKHETSNFGFISTETNFRERLASVCENCFFCRAACNHLPELPLKLILVGHNPSTHAWDSGYCFSNPTNGFWRLIQGTYTRQEKTTNACQHHLLWNSRFTLPQMSVEEAIAQWRFEHQSNERFTQRNSLQCTCPGLVPTDASLVDQNVLPLTMGIGITDVGAEFPGSNANNFKENVVKQWKRSFFNRLRLHVERAGKSIQKYGIEIRKSEDLGESKHNSAQCTCHKMMFPCAAPKFVAFCGKRQFSLLFNPPLSRVSIGHQDRLPAGWPLCPKHTRVWVLPSPSGRAAMTSEARQGPYLAIKREMDFGCY